jgi:hypothetical protein
VQPPAQINAVLWLQQLCVRHGSFVSRNKNYDKSEIRRVKADRLTSVTDQLCRQAKFSVG